MPCAPNRSLRRTTSRRSKSRLFKLLIGRIVRPDAALDPIAPSSALERALIEVWHGILKRSDIGVTDNVFQFGADPLRAELAAGLIAESTGHRLTTKVLYASPTVRELAESLANESADRPCLPN